MTSYLRLQTILTVGFISFFGFISLGFAADPKIPPTIQMNWESIQTGDDAAELFPSFEQLLSIVKVPFEVKTKMRLEIDPSCIPKEYRVFDNEVILRSDGKQNWHLTYRSDYPKKKTMQGGEAIQKDGIYYRKMSDTPFIRRPAEDGEIEKLFRVQDGAKELFVMQAPFLVVKEVKAASEPPFGWEILLSKTDKPFPALPSLGIPGVGDYKGRLLVSKELNLPTFFELTSQFNLEKNSAPEASPKTCQEAPKMTISLKWMLTTEGRLPTVEAPANWKNPPTRQRSKPREVISSSRRNR